MNTFLHDPSYDELLRDHGGKTDENLRTIIGKERATTAGLTALSPTLGIAIAFVTFFYASTPNSRPLLPTILYGLTLLVVSVTIAIVVRTRVPKLEAASQILERRERDSRRDQGIHYRKRLRSFRSR